jgi:hypothetical protein
MLKRFNGPSHQIRFDLIRIENFLNSLIFKWDLTLRLAAKLPTREDEPKVRLNYVAVIIKVQ